MSQSKQGGVGAVRPEALLPPAAAFPSSVTGTNGCLWCPSAYQRMLATRLTQYLWLSSALSPNTLPQTPPDHQSPRPGFLSPPHLTLSAQCAPGSPRLPLWSFSLSLHSHSSLPALGSGLFQMPLPALSLLSTIKTFSSTAPWSSHVPVLYGSNSPV